MKKFKRPTLRPTLTSPDAAAPRAAPRTADDLVVFARSVLDTIARHGVSMDARLAVRAWAQRHPIDKAILRIEHSDSPDSWRRILEFIIENPTAGGIVFPIQESSQPHDLTGVVDMIEDQPHMDDIRHHVMREMTINDLRMLDALKHIPPVDTVDDMRRIITRLVDNRSEFQCLESMFEIGRKDDDGDTVAGLDLTIDDLRAFIRQASFWPSPRSDISRFIRGVLLRRIRSAVEAGDTVRLSGLLDPLVLRRIQKPEDWRRFIRILPFYPNPASFETHRSIVLDLMPAVPVITPDKPKRAPPIRTKIPDRNYIPPHIPHKHIEILIRTMPWIHERAVIDILISAIGEDGSPSLIDPFYGTRVANLFSPNNDFFAVVIGEEGRLNGVWGEDDLLRLPNKKAYAVYTLDASQKIERFTQWRSLRSKIRACVERGISPRLLSIEQDRLGDKPMYTFSEDFIGSIRRRAVGTIVSLLPNILDPAYQWDSTGLAEDIEIGGCFRPDATLRDYWACLHHARMWLDPSTYAFSERRIATARFRCGHVLPSAIGCSPASVYFPEIYLLSADDRRHVMTMIESDVRESVRLEGISAFAQFFPEIMSQRKPIRTTILFNLRDTFEYPQRRLDSVMAELGVSDPTLLVWDDQDHGRAFRIGSPMPDHVRDIVHQFLDVESVCMGENAAVFADGPIFKYAISTTITTTTKDDTIIPDNHNAPIIIPNLMNDIIQFVSDFKEGIVN